MHYIILYYITSQSNHNIGNIQEAYTCNKINHKTTMKAKFQVQSLHLSSYNYKSTTYHNSDKKKESADKFEVLQSGTCTSRGTDSVSFSLQGQISSWS